MSGKNSKYPWHKECYLRLYLFKTQMYFFALGVAPYWLLAFFTGWSLFWYLPIITVIIAFLDVRSRFKDFKQIRHSINEKNYMRYVKKMHFSPCRRAVVASAYGDIKFINKIFHRMGYRWYHMLPDQLHKRVLSKAYWKSALFR